MHMEIRNDMPMPQIAPGKAIVKMEYCGVCGSDVHFYREGHVGDVVAPKDFILGHEVAGTVVEVADDVKNIKPGDRVALEPGYPCGKCKLCRTGFYNLCTGVRFFADPPTPGALQEYVIHPADMCFPLPDNVSTMEGALVEPLAVGLHATAQGNVRLGDRVIILGGGCIGLVTLMSAKARGASEIVMVDLYEKRLAVARELGATDTIDASKEDVEGRVRELFHGEGADIVFETAGSPHTIAQTSLFARRGGTVVLVGMASDAVLSYNLQQVMLKELTIKSVFRYRNLYPTAIAAISSGSIDVKKIVSNEFSFEDSDLAFRTAVEKAADVVKAVIKF